MNKSKVQNVLVLFLHVAKCESSCVSIKVTCTFASYSSFNIFRCFV